MYWMSPSKCAKVLSHCMCNKCEFITDECSLHGAPAMSPLAGEVGLPREGLAEGLRLAQGCTSRELPDRALSKAARRACRPQYASSASPLLPAKGFNKQCTAFRDDAGETKAAAKCNSSQL